MNTYILIAGAIVISVVISFFVAKAKVGPMGPMGPVGRAGAAGKAGSPGVAGGKITFGNLATLSAGTGYWPKGAAGVGTATLGPNEVQKDKFRRQMASNTVNLLTSGPTTNSACDPNSEAYNSKSKDWRENNCGKDLMDRLSKEVVKYINKNHNTKETVLPIHVQNSVGSEYVGGIKIFPDGGTIKIYDPGRQCVGLKEVLNNVAQITNCR